MIGSWELIWYCLIAGSGWVLIMSFVHEALARKPLFASGLPDEFNEPYSIGLFLVQYLIDILFYVAIPTLGYGFFAVIFPLAGVRPAMAAALALFAIGMLPIVIGMTARVRFNLAFLLFYLCINFLKLAGALCIIGYLFSL